MQRISSPARMQALAWKWRRAGTRVGFVPTMGYLHEGHLSLVRRARQRVGPRGRVVLSIYVNPTQFAPTEDLSKYPRDLKRDLAMCREAGVDVVFHPMDAAMYPGREEGGYSTYVVEESLGGRLEGASRPTHFRGVTTIVAKLFQLVMPEVAVFGAKDWQQAAVVGRMVRDLNLPVRVVVAPTVRESDGLAMSSRNKYLTGPQRAQATVLSQALKRARERVRKGDASGVPAAELRKELENLIGTAPEARVDYVAFVDGRTLEPVERVKRGHRVVLAVFVGRTRLIDNGET